METLPSNTQKEVLFLWISRSCAGTSLLGSLELEIVDISVAVGILVCQNPVDHVDKLLLGESRVVISCSSIFRNNK